MDNITPRALARRIVNQRTDRVLEYVLKLRARHGNQLVDDAMNYISEILQVSKEN